MTTKQSSLLLHSKSFFPDVNFIGLTPDLVVIRGTLFIVDGDALLDVLDDGNGLEVLPAFLAFDLLGLTWHWHRNLFANLNMKIGNFGDSE